MFERKCESISLIVVQVIEHKCILKFKAGRLHIFSTLEFKWHLLHYLFVCKKKTFIYGFPCNSVEMYFLFYEPKCIS